MPLYTYVCDVCGHRLTLLRAISERDLPVLCMRGVDFSHHELGRLFMRRTYEAAATHFHGLGVTRGAEAKGSKSEHGGESPAT